MAADHSLRIINWVVYACVAVLIITSIGTTVYARSLAGQRRDDLIASCERGNTIRQSLNAIVRQVDNGLQPLPLVQCEVVVR